MKISEVCERTGLTKRTIRFYIEKELIDPKIVERNFKEYREYSEEDVEQLLLIAELRKALFSIEQIRIMQENPERIPEVVREYRSELSKNFNQLSKLTAAAEAIDSGKMGDIEDLVKALAEGAEGMSLPERDISPNFRRLDEQFGDEEDEEERSFISMRYFTKGFALFMAAVLVVTFAVCYTSWKSRVSHPEFAEKEYELVSAYDGGIRQLEYTNGEMRVAVCAEQEEERSWYNLKTLAFSRYRVSVMDARDREWENRPKVIYIYEGDFETSMEKSADSEDMVWLVGKYDTYGFARYAKVTYIEETPVEQDVEGQAVTADHISSKEWYIDDYENMSEEEWFLVSAITAYRNYETLSDTVLLPLIIAAAGGMLVWLIFKLWWKNRGYDYFKSLGRKNSGELTRVAFFNTAEDKRE